ncbi:Hypothetical protein ACI5QM_00880 [Bacillus subtilis]
MTVQDICIHLGISRSSYYRWKKNLKKQIGTLCREHQYRYGYRKITAILKKRMCINHKTVQRIMQKNQWQCRVKVKKRKKNGQPYAVVDNILDRNFQSDHPLEKLVTDITYLPYGQKQLYLSSILDVYNGEVIAFTIGDKQDTDFVLHTLDQLPTLPENCVLHSDQGSVYTSYEYQKAVKTKGITMSMSRKGTPADNASIESFHSSLKSETFYLNSIDRTTTAGDKGFFINEISFSLCCRLLSHALALRGHLHQQARLNILRKRRQFPFLMHRELVEAFVCFYHGFCGYDFCPYQIPPKK